jgi:hypothetical protein
MLFLLFVLIRTYIFSKKSIPVELFAAALKAENSGNYPEAIAGYQTALIESRKSKMNRLLADKILEKIKILNSVIAYQKVDGVI